MKLKILVAFPFLLAGCSTGKIDIVKDSFTGETFNTLDIGQIKSEESFGLMYEIRCKLVERQGVNNSPEYFIKLYTYSESDGQSCPSIKANSKAIFVVDGKNIELKTNRDSIISKMRPGLLAAGCMETDIDIGPLSKDFLTQIINQKELKFRVYGDK